MYKHDDCIDIMFDFCVYYILKLDISYPFNKNRTYLHFKLLLLLSEF